MPMVESGLGAVGEGDRCGLRCLGGVSGQGVPETLLGAIQLNAVLRALGSGDGGHDRGEVQLEVLGVDRLARRIVPQTLNLGVCLDQCDSLFIPARQAQVVQSDVVNGEDGSSGAELRTHIADCGAVGQRHGGHALAIELDELPHHSVDAQHLGNGEHDIGGGGTGRNRAGEPETDYARDEHGHRLTEHGRLGLDTAHSPAQHAHAVDRGRV